MAKDIDFLPARYREEHAQRKRRMSLALAAALLVVLILAAGFVQFGRRRHYQQELAATEARYEAVVARGQQLSLLQADLKAARAQADLIVYLRHPWPRTRILAVVLTPLPESIQLDELHLARDKSGTQDFSFLRDRMRGPARTIEEKQIKPSPAEADLQQLRAEIDTTQLVVTMSGTASDNAALHGYLGELGKSNLFRKVELLSIESLPDSESPRSQFRARLTLTPGYGQTDGPPPARSPLAQAGAPSPGGQP